MSERTIARLGMCLATLLGLASIIIAGRLAAALIWAATGAP